MNISFNTAPATPAPSAAAANAAGRASPAAPAAGAPFTTVTPVAGGVSALPSFALPSFAQLLGLAGAPDGATAQDVQAPLPADAAADAAKPAEDGAGETEHALLAAMALPLMAAPPALPLPTTLLAAAPAAPADEARHASAAREQSSAALDYPALNLSPNPAAIALHAQSAAVLPAAPQATQAAYAGAVSARPGGAPMPAAHAGWSGDTALAPAGAASARPVLAAAAATSELDRPATAGASAGGAPSFGISLAGAAGQPAANSDTVKLAGPAPQWQETLKDALGERLQVQLARNSEHAVIRLDPPMLGRIEISIRHAAGALQVNLSASNGEVLRQLQGIGESMRNDLAQRQYTDVAVHIAAVPRSPAAQTFAEGDARQQRQSGRQQDDTEPGRALSDAGQSTSTFALNERE